MFCSDGESELSSLFRPLKNKSYQFWIVSKLEDIISEISPISFFLSTPHKDQKLMKKIHILNFWYPELKLTWVEAAIFEVEVLWVVDLLVLMLERQIHLILLLPPAPRRVC